MESKREDQTDDRGDLAASLLDPDRFGRLFDRHVRAVHHFLARRTSDDEADDLTSATFVAAFRGRSSYDPDHASPRAWLFGIATNQVHHHRRSHTRRVRALERLSSPLPPELATDALDTQLDARARVDAALALIGDDLRDVVLLIAVGELTYAECAAALGVPLGTVRSRYARARQELRALLEEPNPTTFAFRHLEERTS